MKRTNLFTLLFASLLLISPVAEAQYIGDALAGAGVNMSEEQARAAIAARCSSVECIQRVEESRKAESEVGTMTSSADVPTMTSSAPKNAEQTAAEQRAQIEQIRREAGGTTTQAPGQAPTPASSSKPEPTKTAASFPPLPVPTGPASGFAGASMKRASEDPTETAAWHEAYKSVGTRVSAKPDGESLKVGSQTYISNLGVFYQQSGSSWVVVPAPIGAIVSHKPLPASTHFADGKPVSYYYGTFYIYRSDLKKYEVVQPPPGVNVNYVPDTAQKVTVDGNVYYKHGDTLFRPYYQGSSLVFVTA